MARKPKHKKLGAWECPNCGLLLASNYAGCWRCFRGKRPQPKRGDNRAKGGANDESIQVSAATGYTAVVLPKGAQVLYAAIQREDIQLWALIDPNEHKTERRRFLFVGTGHTIEGAEPLTHVSSFFSDPSGSYVFHVFEVNPLEATRHD